MELSMTVLRCPDQVAPEARTVSGGEFHVGRGPDVDWVLPDPDRLLSKRHFAVAFRGGGWQVADTSTNGTYLNTEADAIGRGTARNLRDGDRLRLGAYEIEIRLVEQAAQGMGSGMRRDTGFGGGGQSRPSQSPFGDPFADDLLAPSPPPRRAFDEPAYRDLNVPPTSAQLPHDFDPLAPDRDDPAFDGGFHGPVQSDHSSSMDDAMIPPPIASYNSPQTGGIIPADDLLPDDWDKDLLEGISPPAPAPSPSARDFVTTSPPIPARHESAGHVPADHAMEAGAGRRAMPVEPDPFIPTAPEAPAPYRAPPPPAPEPAPYRTSGPQAPASVPTAFDAPAAAPVELPDFLNEPDPFETQSHAPQSPPEEPIAMPPPVVAPVVRQRAPRPTAAPPPLGVDQFLEPEPRPIRQQPPESAPEPAPQTAFPPIGASPFDEPSDQPAPRSAPPVAASMTPSVRPSAAPVVAGASNEGGLLEAFFKGAELNGATPSDPAATMTALGKAFRATVAGLRATLIARATIKSEFRIDQTMIQARDNNPLKFSANDDDALTALLGVGRRTEMAPANAIEDALRDIRLHEVAVMAAMQVAIRTMLEELSPDKIRAKSDQGGIAVLPGQRKARAWDTFEAAHAATLAALSDDFDSVFGKAFVRAYERALDEISTRERQ